MAQFQMPELLMPDYVGGAIKGYELGRASGQKQKYNGLARTAAGAYGTQRDQALAEMAGIDPEGAQAYGSNLQKQDDAYAQKAQGAAKYVLQQYKSGDINAARAAYAYALPALQKAAAMHGAQAPAEFDESQIAGLEALAAAGGQEQLEQYTLAPGSARYDAAGNLIAQQPYAPEKPEYQWDGERGVWIPKPMMAGQPSAEPGMARAPTTGGGGALLGTSFEDAVGPLLAREGGYVANDAGAGPTNFGINSRANPDINVASLTPESAAQIYRDRYWNAIDADNLPPQIRQAAFDAAVNMGPEVAKRLVQESGGDPERFAALRQGRYDSLVQSNPQKYGQFADGWANRNRETAGLAAIPVAGIAPKRRDESTLPAGWRWADEAHTRQEPIPGGPADRKNNPMPADMAKDERQMRQELTSQLKDQRTVVQAYQKVQAAASNPNAMSDIALIYGYMKMLDPGSVVREGEFATAQNAAGVPDQVRNMLNRTLQGTRLNPQQRQQIVAEARKVHDIAYEQIAEKEREYGALAEQYGYDPVRATGSQQATPEARQRKRDAVKLLNEARDAIRAGADRNAVRKRLEELGFKNTAGRL